jgi:hypothetical protein
MYFYLLSSRLCKAPLPAQSYNIRLNLISQSYEYTVPSTTNISYPRNYAPVSTPPAPFLRVLETTKLNKFREENSFQFFGYLQHLEFFSFFKSLQIDTPSKFQPISSNQFFLRKKTFLLRWNNFLMRKGKRQAYLKLFLNVLLQILSMNFLRPNILTTNLHWQYFSLFLSSNTGTYGNLTEKILKIYDLG